MIYRHAEPVVYVPSDPAPPTQLLPANALSGPPATSLRRTTHKPKPSQGSRPIHPLLAHLPSAPGGQQIPWGLMSRGWVAGTEADVPSRGGRERLSQRLSHSTGLAARCTRGARRPGPNPQRPGISFPTLLSGPELHSERKARTTGVFSPLLGSGYRSLSLDPSSHAQPWCPTCYPQTCQQEQGRLTESRNSCRPH